jgi:four helix bundle protein
MPGNDKLSRFGAHKKALELFDLVVSDVRPLTTPPALARLVSQQLGSADSIVANIEEGYGRGSPRDYAHFLIMARGSAQETAGRYQRLKHWIDQSVIDARRGLCNEIIAILTTTIVTLRAKT